TVGASGRAGITGRAARGADRVCTVGGGGPLAWGGEAIRFL
ncbi:uncharacterized protein METZ01_LOCUS466506, partial [marine metagenome]